MGILANVYSAVGVGLRDPLLNLASRSVTSCFCVQDSVPAPLLFFSNACRQGWWMVLWDCSSRPEQSTLSLQLSHYSTFTSSLHFNIFEQCSRSTTARHFAQSCPSSYFKPPPPLFVMPCTVVSCLNINQHACQGMSSFCFVDLRKAETTAVK